MKTPELMERLRRHYIKPGPMPGGVFVAECGQNGSWGASGRCDALHVGFTSASGRLLTGHEVKVSRADWLAELRKPGKADQWADQCHRWYLVTSEPEIVQPGELPAGWGHMVPGTSKTRMKVLVQPEHRDVRPSWDACRSIMARLDTLQRGERLDLENQYRRAVHDEATAEVQRLRELDAAREGRELVSAEDRTRLFALERLENALGVSITDYDAQHVAPEDLGAALTLVKSARMANFPEWTLEQLERGLAAAREVAKAVDAFANPANHREEKTG